MFFFFFYCYAVVCCFDCLQQSCSNLIPFIVVRYFDFLRQSCRKLMFWQHITNTMSQHFILISDVRSCAPTCFISYIRSPTWCFHIICQESYTNLMFRLIKNPCSMFLLSCNWVMYQQDLLNSQLPTWGYDLMWQPWTKLMYWLVTASCGKLMFITYDCKMTVWYIAMPRFIYGTRYILSAPYHEQYFTSIYIGYL